MITYWDKEDYKKKLAKLFEKSKSKNNVLSWREKDEFIRRGSKDNNIVNKKRESYNGTKRVIN
jgi:hypothetical protein